MNDKVWAVILFGWVLLCGTYAVINWDEQPLGIFWLLLAFAYTALLAVRVRSARRKIVIPWSIDTPEGWAQQVARMNAVMAAVYNNEVMRNMEHADDATTLRAFADYLDSIDDATARFIHRDVDRGYQQRLREIAEKLDG